MTTGSGSRSCSVAGGAEKRLRVVPPGAHRSAWPGGSLEMMWNPEDNHVYMTGPAEFVFDGEWLLD